MVGGKNKNKVRSAPVTPEQNQEVDFEEEGEESEVEEVNTPIILQEAAGAQSDPAV